MSVTLAPDQKTRPSDRFHGPSSALILGIVLLIGLANGLLYVFIVPPWQHYDEPGHFEYVWLVANRPGLPKPGDYDPEFSRQVVGSMVANRFYGDTTTGLPAPGEEVRIPGYNQLDEKPTYYLLASLPVRLAGLAGVEDVANQLRAARLGSLLLFLFTLVCAWGIARELAPPGHPLRWMLPLSLALLPGFVDLMTAVNNDVAAIAAFSLFLWGGARLIQRRLGWVNVLWVIGAAVLCYFTKVTALLALALLPLLFLIAISRGAFRPVAWAALALGMIGLLLAALTWGDAALWARSTFQEANTRQETDQAPLGEHAFLIQLQPGSSSAQDFQLSQLIVKPKGGSLRDQTITVGAWMWADQPIKVSSPVFNTYSALKWTRQEVEIDQTPRFIAFTYPIEGDAQRNFVSLAPLLAPVTSPVNVFYDGLVVALGEYPTDQAPLFDSPEAESGEWGGQRFQNLVRNASAEATWFRLRPWVDEVGVRILPDKGANLPSVTMYYLADLRGSWPWQRISMQVLARTFWARFGWGHVPLMHALPYWLIGIGVVLGLIGAIVAMTRARQVFPWNVALFFGLALAGVLLQTYIRGANYPTQLRAIYYPTARYAYPAIIPALAFLNLGWYEAGRALQSLFHIPRRVLSIAYIATWVIFNLYALLSIANFYSLLA